MGDFDSLIISEKNMKYIRDIFRPKQKSYGKGEIILDGQAPDNRLCVLLKGTAYLCVEQENGGRQLLDYFTKGQLICPEMLPGADNGHCFILAKYPCTAACLSHQELQEHMLTHSDSDLTELFSHLLHAVIHAGNEHCHILQQKTIRSKLTAYLRAQSVRQGSTSVHIPIPYSDLADYLAIDRSSLMTELSRMDGEGIIEKKGRVIVLDIKNRHL